MGISRVLATNVAGQQMHPQQQTAASLPDVKVVQSIDLPRAL